MQEMKISITNAVRIIVSEDLRYKLMKCGDVSSCRRKAKGCRNGSRRTSQKEVWPPSSPNYSLLDYFVWGVSELLFNAKPRNKIKDIIQKLKMVMGSLERGTVAKAY